MPPLEDVQPIMRAAFCELATTCAREAVALALEDAARIADREELCNRAVNARRTALDIGTAVRALAARYRQEPKETKA